ncbi:LamG domain-containing protein [Flavobacteriaceae bacterium]|nr:LamG domain-containing protein [Flavobacteriaceae bacterium]MDB4186440.1 LamG domain-containing protein [Flavobacteriaceae bacterium]
MKKFSLTLLLGLVTLSVYGQIQEIEGVKSVVSAAASRAENLNHTVTDQSSPTQTVTIHSVSMVVGSPYLGIVQSPFQSATPSNYSVDYQKDLGFPWGIYYAFDTFEERSLKISKGYYSDRVDINWDISNNSDKITGYNIYRTADITSENPDWGQPIRTLSSIEKSYEDEDVQGGKLYKYKIKAKGVVTDDPDIPYVTYITGIGYRNPAAVITGNVSFEGGNPVEGVTIAAVPDGGFSDFGSALNIPAGGYAQVEQFHSSISTSITLQAWARPQASFSSDAIRMISLTSSRNNTIDFEAGISNNRLTVNVGNHSLSINGYMPNGNVNNQDNDILIPITDYNTQFVHFSAVLVNGEVPKIFINGRKIDSDYVTTMNELLANSTTYSPTTTVILNDNGQALTFDTDSGGVSQIWTGVKIGGQKDAHLDEIRLWTKSLDDEQIKRDYKLYLKGNEDGLHTYIRANERLGKFAYDLARTGFDFHGNDLNLTPSLLNEAQYPSFDIEVNNRPTNNQLGIYGVTNANGSYVIPSIPYEGTGQTFVITPSKGVHEFNPSSELIFLGEGSTVANNIDFTDVSSFNFNGRALYDSRGVFPQDPSDPIGGIIVDNEAYNAYIVDGVKYPKAEYWAQYGTGSASATIQSLVRYAPIPVTEAGVYIDGRLVLDEDNQPVQTDQLGRFTISVPIGLHKITVKKYNHVFKYNGNYPAEGELDYFQDNDEEVVFIDETRVSVVGRVVGGAVEANKPIGFGFDGAKSYSSTPTEDPYVYTSKNNIGTASVTFGYRSPGASSITPEFQTSFSTNVDTGEYKVSILPLNYELSQADVYIPSQLLVSDQTFLEAGEVFDFSNITPDKNDYFVFEQDTIATSLPFNFKKSFIYRSDPLIDIISQETDGNLTIGEDSYVVTNTSFGIYSQGRNYTLEVRRVENYTNYELPEQDQLDVVPVTDGELLITNELASDGEGSETVTTNENDESIITYQFKAGDPNVDISTNFVKSLSLIYRINGIDNQISNYLNQGVIIGSSSSEGATFQTAGPQVPDIILRDPPGSASYASIERGTTYSISKKNSGNFANNTEVDLALKLGVKFGIGGGLLGPFIENENYAEATTGINVGLSTSNGEELTKTYTFGQTISTSDNPDWVGSDADLYIGSSTNQFYGLMNDLYLTSTPVTNPAGIQISVPITTTTGVLYLSLRKILVYGPGDEVTNFVYSQRQIITEIIPEFEEIVANYACIMANRDEDPTNDVACPISIGASSDLKDLVWYQNQIKLWQRVIQLNEEKKYLARSDRDALKATINAEINENFSIAGVLTRSGSALRSLLNGYFYENISFDSGVGSIEKSIESGNTTAWEHTFATNIEASVGLELGLDISGAGFTANVKNTSSVGYGYDQNEEIEDNLVYSYVLQDNDDYNKLSVDVINAMDGNGPIFITRGGETSCPVEGPQYANYFHPELQPVVAPQESSLRTLLVTETIELSAGTVAIEVPYISVDNTSVSGVPDGSPAEFTLTLRNDSVLFPEDSDFILYVNNNTNPNNAIINLDPYGTPFFLDGAESVQFNLTVEKGTSDVYDYEDIELVFESACDDDLSETVTISAYFIESCSRVNVLQPSNNWVKNNLNTVAENRNIPLNIVLNEFDLSFDSFEKIVIEYRQAGTSEWIRLHTYVTDQVVYDQLVSNGNTAVSTLTTSAVEISYAWDIVGQTLADGDYEIRSKTFCSNGTEFTSQVVNGKVDLTPPTVFGTPQPTNGILSIGSDLIVRFNEPVKANGTLTRYEFNVQKNQLPVNHEVSLSFAGSTNTGEIDSPFIKSGNFGIEFWLKNQVQGSSVLLAQEGGLRIEVNGSQMQFRIGGEIISGQIANDGTWNHYALSYNNETGQLILIENDNEVTARVVTTDLSFNNNNSITIGGNNFVGNVHDLRFWSKYISRETAVAAQNELLNGNEANLIGYWPMNEGHGTLANDISRYKHLQLSYVNWDIFPNGTSYQFDGNQYVGLSRASNVIVTRDMDMTLSFWMKTSQDQRATLVSNGRGDTSDLLTNNNYRNKWAIDLNENGGIELKAEGQTFPFGTTEVNDDSWHHIALVLRRTGNLSLFIDGERTATSANSELGGFSGSKIFVGARGQFQVNGSEIVDQYYTGLIDELRIWSAAKSADQIMEDQYFEANYESLGLMLYAPFNAPEVTSANGPRYYYPLNSIEKASTNAELFGGQVQYSDNSPPIKPTRPVERLIVNASINQDEVFLIPQITDWASVEQKVANVTIANLYDYSDNRQLSPVTYSVFINKNPLKWYIEGYGSVINLVKPLEESATLDISIVNRSGTEQPYYVSGPSWLNIPDARGTVPPNSTIVIRAEIGDDVSPGKYDEEIVLANDYGFDEKIQLNLRVIAQELDWDFTPTDFDESMNIIGKIRVDNEISMDFYDKVIAYIGDEVRGVGELLYVEQYDEYFVLLTVHGGNTESDPIEFRIWDASVGRLKVASIEGGTTVNFTPNELFGDFQSPLVFANTIQETQPIQLSEGWSWVSFNVAGNLFNDLNAFTENLSLQTSDIIVSNRPARFDTYEINPTNPEASGWNGTISSNGGLNANQMYKVRLAEAQTLFTTGSRVDPSLWTFELAENWNWLPYILNARVPVNEAMARLDARAGDLIKSQSAFAIYDGSNGWIGTLTHLGSGEGYMLRASQAQTFSYPSYFSSKATVEQEIEKATLLEASFAAYPENMNVIAELPEGYDSIRFYTEEGILVGQGDVQYANGKHIAFVTIFGDTVESLKVAIGCEDDFKAVRTSLEFVPDGLIGTLDEPLKIDELEWIGQTFEAYPNPAVDFVYANFDSKVATTAELIVYNLQMQRVYNRSIDVVLGENTLRIPMGENVQGSYVLHLNVGDRTFSKVVIKK